MHREERLAVLCLWAKEHHCRIVKDECRDEIVLGKYGLIREYNSHLRLIYMPNQEDHTARTTVRWNNRSDNLAAAGCTILIDAHGEGVALFNPNNPEQSQLAIAVAGVRQKRRFDPEQMKELAAKGRAALEAKKAQHEPAFSLINL
jgi:hypothetical protein